MAADELTPGLYVGVDSGGTRTNVHWVLRPIYDSTPIEKDYEVPESLSGALADDLVPSVFRKILSPLESKIDQDLEGLRAYLWINAAGYTPWTRDHYQAALRELAPELLGGRIQAIGAANDAVSLLLGSGADGVVIAGTGSSVVFRSRDGTIHQAGGHEWVACDYGSAFWIGIRGIREAYRDFEGGRSSALLNRFCELYGIDERDTFALVKKLRDMAIADRDMKKDIARFAQYVCALAARGDEAAQNLVKLEAEELADVAATSARRHFARPELLEGIRVLQCGSLLSESEFYRTSFETQLDLRLLSDDAAKAKITWERATTGAQHAITLARELVHDPSKYLDIDLFFRPVVIQP